MNLPLAVAANPASRVVCNCGPLIALAGVGQLDLLPQLFRQVCIPTEVYDELTGSQRFESVRNLFHQPWLEIIPLPTPCDPLLTVQLDTGEAAVLTLARLFPGAEVLMDERKGRRLAERLFGLRVLGTGGLLLRAKRAGLIPAVQPVLVAMKNNGYHLSDRLMQAIWQAAGEKPHAD